MRRLPAFRHDEETNQERRDKGHDDLRLLMPRKLHVPSPLLLVPKGQLSYVMSAAAVAV